MYRPSYAPPRPAPEPSSTSGGGGGGPLKFTTAPFAHNARVAAALLPALAMVLGPADRAVLGLALVSLALPVGGGFARAPRPTPARSMKKIDARSPIARALLSSPPH
jgi:hypothetical protein